VVAATTVAAKKLVVRVEVAEAVRVAIGDSARIRRILYSLSDNAVKFTETAASRSGRA